MNTSELTSGHTDQYSFRGSEQFRDDCLKVMGSRPPRSVEEELIDVCIAMLALQRIVLMYYPASLDDFLYQMERIKLMYTSLKHHADNEAVIDFAAVKLAIHSLSAKDRYQFVKYCQDIFDNFVNSYDCIKEVFLVTSIVAARESGNRDWMSAVWDKHKSLDASSLTKYGWHLDRIFNTSVEIGSIYHSGRYHHLRVGTFSNLVFDCDPSRLPEILRSTSTVQATVAALQSLLTAKQILAVRGVPEKVQTNKKSLWQTRPDIHFGSAQLPIKTIGLYNQKQHFYNLPLVYRCTVSGSPMTQFALYAMIRSMTPVGTYSMPQNLKYIMDKSENQHAFVRSIMKLGNPNLSDSWIKNWSHCDLTSSNSIAEFFSRLISCLDHSNLKFRSIK